MLMTRVLIAFGASVLVCAAQAQQKPAATGRAPAAGAPPVVSPTLFANSVTSGRQALALRRRWGIDHIHLRYTASGALIRFSYRVVDADSARALNDKRATPHLISERTGEQLKVPETEMIGKLRQTSPPENGREYWVAFANAGRRLQPGDRVKIEIGAFHAEDLVIESPGPTPRPENP
jgi:hypothetical protein